jgi:hypothetical protein
LVSPFLRLVHVHAGFLIPGCSASALVVFTVIHRRHSEESQLLCDVFLGQAIVSLQTMIDYGQNEREMTLNLEHIEVGDFILLLMMCSGDAAPSPLCCG